MKLRVGILILVNLALAFGLSAQEDQRIREFFLAWVEANYEDSFIPDNEMVPPIETNTSFIAIVNRIKAEQVNLKKPIILREELERVLLQERPIDYENNKKQGFLPFGSWGEFGCCRRSSNGGEGQQVRARIVSSFLAVQNRRCSWNFCIGCRNSFSLCSRLSQRFRACSERSQYRSFMSQYCPSTCGYCSSGQPSQPGHPFPTRPQPTFPTRPQPTFPTRPQPTFPTRPQPTFPAIQPTQPPTPPPKPLYREVRVYFRPQSIQGSGQPALNYKYVTSESNLGYPWFPVSQSPYPGEVASFYLYTKPTSSFQVAVHFCKLNQGINEIWQVASDNCPPGWATEFVLYGSSGSGSNKRFLFVSNTINQQPTMSRIHNESLCCGYKDLKFFFFVPDPKTLPPPVPTNFQTTPTTTNIFNRFPTTTRYNPFPTTTRFNPFPTTTRFNPFPTTTRFNPFPTTASFNPFPTAPNPGNSGISPFGRECLERHNFFRAVHNTAPLQWDANLAGFADRWARHLARVAPGHPNEGGGTRNWPHSDANGRDRQSNTGENIAWDKSSDGSPAWESVQRWYAEIFDYNKNSPTRSANGKPIGHYTQMLWKNTKFLGCANAIADDNLNSNQQFRLQSTYTVAHYAPAGNIRYPTQAQTLRIYHENVQDLRQGACKSNCVGDSKCMGFANPSSCQCLSSGPRCSGGGVGCFAECSSRSGGFQSGFSSFVRECYGKNTCYCSSEPVNNVRGAICT